MVCSKQAFSQYIKDKLMFFGNHILKTHVSIHISKEEISKVEFNTFLGVLIDNKLTWKKHISMIKSKLSKSCAIMYRASFVIDKCGMLMLYHSLFLPYITYCIEVRGNTYATNLNCLVLLQKKIVCLICRAKRLDHTSCLFSELRILKEQDIATSEYTKVVYIVQVRLCNQTKSHFKKKLCSYQFKENVYFS